MSTGGSFNPNSCEVVNEGNLLCDQQTDVMIEINGEKPNNGIISFIDGVPKTIELIYQDKKVILNNEGKFVLGDTVENAICKLVSGNANEIGTKYQCEVKSKTKYYFYVLSHNDDGTTNLIMDRNICQDGTMATAINTCLVAWNSNNINSSGPTTIMSYLNNATSSWENIPNLNMTYVDEGEKYNELMEGINVKNLLLEDKKNILKVRK